MSNLLNGFQKTALVLFIGVLVVGSRHQGFGKIAVATNIQRIFPVQADRIFDNEKIINFFSVFTKEPDDAADRHLVPDTKQAAYDFPIQNIKRHQDSNQDIRLDGVIHVSGDACATALPLLNQFFSNAGGLSRLGTRYIVNIHFEPAPSSSADAVELSWLNESELKLYASENPLHENSNNAKMVVGFTQLGSRSVKINPVYSSARTMKFTFANWPINTKQLRDTIKHTRGVFAHEMAHAMGLSHMRNHTNSIVSYAPGRKVTGDDAQAICLLVSDGDEQLCPE
jgi:hypothetical protein